MHGQCLFQTQLKRSRILRRNQRERFPLLLLSGRQHTSLGVKAHMNTKMILAALALSLSLVGCAKKEAPAEAAQDAAATASDAAGEAAGAATDAAAAAGDAAQAAGDAAQAAGDAAATDAANAAGEAADAAKTPAQ
jgi:hypothetical protein